MKKLRSVSELRANLDSGSPASEILAVNVRALIERVGSGAELARLTGVPQKTISRIVNGENATTLDTLNDLADGLRCEPWRLLVPGLDFTDCLWHLGKAQKRGAITRPTAWKEFK